MRLPVRPPPKEPSLAARGLELAKAGEGIGFFKTILSDPYDPDENPHGFVNIGTAENVGQDLLTIIRQRLHR